MITVYYLDNKCPQKKCNGPMQLALTDEFDWQAECMQFLHKQGKPFANTEQAAKAGFILKKHNILKENSK